MAYTTINKSTDYFNTKLYTGNGSTQSITGVSFQPDFTWLKSRSNANVHALFDAVRGVTKRISSNDNSAEYTEAGALTAFDSDGFSLGNWTSTNGNGHTLASWNWKANGAGSANTDGATATTVSVNQTAGFSIVKHTGTGSATTLGHGLNAVPKMIISKNLPDAAGWVVYHESIGNTNYMSLNGNGGTSDNTMWNDTTPTSSVFSVGNHNNNNDSSDAIIHYVFAEKTGYSKFGSYVGNGNADGPFIYTGFKPAFFLLKESSAAGEDWVLQDNKRDTVFNPIDSALYASTTSTENTGYRYVDFNSNGFKIRNSQDDYNTSGSTYIYMSFAEAPLVGTNNVPCTAR